MTGIRTNAAAELLGVSPNTLRSWERRFSYPKPRRTQGGHRQYDLAELESLRRALLETHNISSAIELARQRGEGPSTPSRLLDAWDHFDEATRRPRAWRRASPCARSSAASRRCCCRRWSWPADRETREAERELAFRWAHRLAVRLPARGAAGEPLPGRPAVRLEPAPRPRVAARAGARAGPAPRRLPHAAAGLRPPARARGARHPGARPDRVRVLRRRGHPRGGRPARVHGAPGRLGRPGVRVPRGHAGHRRPRHPVARLERRSRPSSASRATSTAAASSRPMVVPEAADEAAARRLAVANARRAGASVTTAQRCHGAHAGLRSTRRAETPCCTRHRPAPPAYSSAGMPLELGDPLAHRALQALLRAEAAVRRRVAAELSREGVSAGRLLRAGRAHHRRRLARAQARSAAGWAGPRPTPPRSPPRSRTRGLVRRRRDPARPPRSWWSTSPASGRELVERLFPSTPTASRRPSAPSTRARSARSPSSAASSRPRLATGARPRGPPRRCRARPRLRPRGDPHPDVQL